MTTTTTMTSQQKPAFVWIQYGNGCASKVSTSDCLDVDDLKEVIKNKLSPELNDVPVHKINLYTSIDQNATPLRPGIQLSSLFVGDNYAGKQDDNPLYVRIIPTEKPISTDPSIRITLEQIKQSQDSIIKNQDYLMKANTLVIEQFLDPWRGTSERTKQINDELTNAVLKYYNYGSSYCMIVGHIGKSTKKNFVKG